jgi:trehalose-6-phosphatase
MPCAHEAEGPDPIILVQDYHFALAPRKGAALSRLMERVGCIRAIYVGDDATDEDAFRNTRAVTGVRVGQTRRSAAGYYLSCHEEADELLRALVRARRRVDGLDAVEGLEHLVATEVA